MLTDRQKLDLISAVAEEEAMARPLGAKIQRMLQMFYIVAHPHPKCKHPEWEKESEAIYKDFKSKNIL